MIPVPFLAVCGLILVLLAGFLAFRGGRSLALLTLLAALVLVGTAATARYALEHQRAAGRVEQAAALPQGGEEPGYVTSRACRSCHPGEYASWHRTYHRTMTQPATPETVLGDFDGVEIRRGAWTYRLERRGDEFWVEMVDPDWERVNRLRGADPEQAPDPPRVERRIVMTTGSHHMQTYWVPSRYGNELLNFPFVYLFEDRRWVPREDVFLRPPGADRFTDLWNDNCLECHSTRGVPGLTEESEAFATRAAELGIACEACHGPAEDHLAANRSPWRRYRLHAEDDADPTIVQPARLAPKRASEVCGQCHGVSLSDARDWLAEGHSFQPGERLEDDRFLLLPARNRNHPRVQRLEEREPQALDSRFWGDGLARVSGREYSAMVESGCFQRGELSCLSCHSMHDSDPKDQLAAGMEGDGACLQCHGDYQDRIEEHAHHPAGTSGASCMNCHMPHTTYGLMSAMRSHTVDSPSVAANLATGRPNACNLCHLDQTLGWTAEHLEAWYGQEKPALSPAQMEVAASVLWALTGDAGLRALAAWNLGWEPALAASGSGWQAPFLGHLLADPYSTVRYIAGKSLEAQPGFSGLAYDYIAPPDERQGGQRAVIERWLSRPWDRSIYRGPQTLVHDDGNLNVQALSFLSRQRDDRPVSLGE